MYISLKAVKQTNTKSHKYNERLNYFKTLFRLFSSSAFANSLALNHILSHTLLNYAKYTQTGSTNDLFPNCVLLLYSPAPLIYNRVLSPMFGLQYKRNFPNK